MPAKPTPEPAQFDQARERDLHRSLLPNDCLRVLQVTDTHLYAEEGGRLLGVDTLESFGAVIKAFQETDWTPDLVLATGDLVHDASPRGYRRLASLLDHFGVPVYCLPGNHDAPQTMRDHLHGEFVSCPQVVDHKGWRLVLLNSVVEGDVGGHLPESELRLLEQAIESSRHPLLVALHHQPVAVGSAWIDAMGLDNPEALRARIRGSAQVKGLLWGHVHQQYDGQLDGVRLMGSPSTCIQFAPGSDEFTVDPQQPGFRLLALMPDGRILSEVMRTRQVPLGLEVASSGYE